MLFKLLLDVASGTRSRSERHGYGQQEFVPWQISAIDVRMRRQYHLTVSINAARLLIADDDPEMLAAYAVFSLIGVLTPGLPRMVAMRSPNTVRGIRPQYCSISKCRVYGREVAR